MAVLLVSYACSGIFSVGSNERAMRLRFGAYVGAAGERVREQGGWAWPFPVEQVIKVDVRPRTLRLDREFWYEVPDWVKGLTREQQQVRLANALDPLKDGSHLTGDHNVVHAQWVVNYQVAQPDEFLSHVGDERLAENLVRCAAQQGIMQAVGSAPADDVLKGKANPERALALANAVLAGVRTGLRINEITLDKASPPVRVAPSVDAVINAENERAQRLETARQDRERILSEMAGEGAEPLLALLDEYDRLSHADASALAQVEARIDEAFNSLRVGPTRAGIGGEAARIINQAVTYRTNVVETVRSEAQTFARLLPEYERNPRIVLSRLWAEAKEAIFTGDVETFYTPAGEVRIKLNRDPNLAQQRQREKLKALKAQPR